MLSVASGGLAPAVRAFVPSATSAVASYMRSSCSLLPTTTTTTVSRCCQAGAVSLWGWGRSGSNRRSFACMGETNEGGGGGGGGGGGRASAAVVQDADRRAGVGKAGKAEKLDLTPPKGTRDVFPEDMRLRNW